MIGMRREEKTITTVAEIISGESYVVQNCNFCNLVYNGALDLEHGAAHKS